MPMCPPCAAAHDRWYDYRSPAPAPMLINPGVTRVRDVVEARSARAESTYRLIGQQQDGIRRDCAAGMHAAVRV